jgi:hypothetical protein
MPALWQRAQVDQTGCCKRLLSELAALTRHIGWRRSISDGRRRAGSRYRGRQGGSQVHRSGCPPAETLTRQTKPATATRSSVATCGSTSAAGHGSSTRFWFASDASVKRHGQDSSWVGSDHQVARGRHSRRRGSRVTKSLAAVPQPGRAWPHATPNPW